MPRTLTPAQRATAAGILWSVTYLDGVRITNLECHWSEISTPVTIGGRTLYLLKDPAATLTAVVAGKSYTLRCPNVSRDGHTAPERFYHLYKSRTALSDSALTYTSHVIGYISSLADPYLDLSMEINQEGGVFTRAVALAPDSGLLTSR